MEPDADLIEKYSRPWLMSREEKFALMALLSELRPRCSMEIGTNRGGSLQVIAPLSGFTHCLDIFPGVKEELDGAYPNVEIHIGNSAENIPDVLRKIKERQQVLEFILVDGDHTTEGVKRDLALLADLEPSGTLWILMHDSGNPAVREAILSTPWADNPHVHSVEVDFIPGHLVREGYYTNHMWGGFAAALLRSTPRSTPLVISRRDQPNQDLLLGYSIHNPHPFRTVTNAIRYWLNVRKRGLMRRLGFAPKHAAE